MRRSLNVKNGIFYRTPEVNRYINDIKNFPMVKAEEEAELFERIRKGDKEAADIIIKANLRFVVACAKQYDACSVPMIDLINEGNIGLIKAVDSFDHTKGFKFISFAVWWIRQAIMSAITENSRMVRLPTTITKDTRKVKDGANEVEQVNEFLDINILAEKLGLDPRNVQAVLDDKMYASLDAPMEGEVDTTFADMLRDEDQFAAAADTEDKRIMVMRYLSILSMFEADVLKRHFGLAPYDFRQTAMHIGDETGFTSVTIDRVVDRSIKKIRKKLRAAEYLNAP